MPRKLIDVFTPNGTEKPRRRGGRFARAQGGKAEGLLLRQLEEIGYEVRRTHLSLFPDIIAWNDTDLLLIEVKSRKYTSTSVSNALSLFRSSFRMLKSIPINAIVLCYLRVDNAWTAYQWMNGQTVQVDSLIDEER